VGRSLRALMLGDVVGQPGCRALYVNLGKIKKNYQADLVVANGENAAEGKGISVQDLEGLFKSGVDVVTSGNHIWQKKEILPILEEDDRLLRPENYPVGVPGKGSYLGNFKDIKVAICNLMGRVQLPDLRCPFRIGKELVSGLRRETAVILLDFHAESPHEKEALGIFLDGSVSALLGTHTHVQTADERILPKGTAYITDIGMTGPAESVIGMDVDTAIRRNITQMPLKMAVANTSARIEGVFLEVESESGKAVHIERFSELSIL
jgi:metallophosphoesterase (TIGR00282 family)